MVSDLKSINVIINDDFLKEGMCYCKTHTCLCSKINLWYLHLGIDFWFSRWSVDLCCGTAWVRSLNGAIFFWSNKHLSIRYYVICKSIKTWKLRIELALLPLLSPITAKVSSIVLFFKGPKIQPKLVAKETI